MRVIGRRIEIDWLMGKKEAGEGLKNRRGGKGPKFADLVCHRL